MIEGSVHRGVKPMRLFNSLFQQAPAAATPPNAALEPEPRKRSGVPSCLPHRTPERAQLPGNANSAPSITTLLMPWASR